ncbi:hypothetical protein SAMN05216338_107524 [Bradyrhizobium sp. Rc2d]|nr:hypothetical protein SAMN05216338_107524 [Bradyrhizobium sp. Rc2d]
MLTRLIPNSKVQDTALHPAKKALLQKLGPEKMLLQFVLKLNLRCRQEELSRSAADAGLLVTI